MFIILNLLIKKLLFIFSTDFKCLTGLYFGAEVLLYAMFAPIWGINSISFGLVWQMLLLSLIIAIFQYVFYVWDLFGNLSRFKKSTICYFTLMIVGTGFINIFNWFNLNNFKNIAIVLVAYTIIFVIMCWVYNLYYKVTGEEYNEKLKLYKSSK